MTAHPNRSVQDSSVGGPRKDYTIQTSRRLIDAPSPVNSPCKRHLAKYNRKACDVKNLEPRGGCSSVGRAQRCQRCCRGFESHHPLFKDAAPFRSGLLFRASFPICPGPAPKRRRHAICGRGPCAGSNAIHVVLMLTKPAIDPRSDRLVGDRTIESLKTQRLRTTPKEGARGNQRMTSETDVTLHRRSWHWRRGKAITARPRRSRSTSRAACERHISVTISPRGCRTLL